MILRTHEKFKTENTRISKLRSENAAIGFNHYKLMLEDRYGEHGTYSENLYSQHNNYFQANWQTSKKGEHEEIWKKAKKALKKEKAQKENKREIINKTRNRDWTQ